VSAADAAFAVYLYEHDGRRKAWAIRATGDGIETRYAACNKPWRRSVRALAAPARHLEIDQRVRAKVRKGYRPVGTRDLTRSRRPDDVLAGRATAAAPPARVYWELRADACDPDQSHQALNAIAGVLKAHGFSVESQASDRIVIRAADDTPWTLGRASPDGGEVRPGLVAGHVSEDQGPLPVLCLLALRARLGAERVTVSDDDGVLPDRITGAEPWWAGAEGDRQRHYTLAEALGLGCPVDAAALIRAEAPGPSWYFE